MPVKIIDATRAYNEHFANKTHGLFVGTVNWQSLHRDGYTHVKVNEDVFTIGPLGPEEKVELADASTDHELYLGQSGNPGWCSGCSPDNCPGCKTDCSCCGL